MENFKILLQKYKGNGPITNKIKMLKTFICLGLVYLPGSLLINLQN